MEFAIFKNFPYRIYIRDMEQTIVYANRLASKFLGLPEEEIIGKTYDEVFLDDSFIEHFIQVDKMLFSEKKDSYTSVHEFNRCYNQEKIIKMVEYLYISNSKKYIVTLLVEISDGYCIEKGLDLRIGDYDPGNRKITLKNKSKISLTRLENSILFLLYEKKGQVVTYDELFMILDTCNTMTKVSLKSIIYRLKRKLKDDIIENVFMKGYRLTIFKWMIIHLNIG